MNIEITEDDIVIRPCFSSDGKLSGYYASMVEGDVLSGRCGVKKTPEEALKRFLEDKWPDVAARAYVRKLLE